ncbi:hypothetical protein BDN71DRAFT_1507372 [Pleurotus eryngii]|uniref:Uncharacterized protein n=1 Tax=Pleurotus eryngii TaxID=5323 RepID=A0A9P5ZVE5_PLEER|nr:hypothetical protein BDN71DRAFT_1507372 [Pleurotus eryngii]
MADRGSILDMGVFLRPAGAALTPVPAAAGTSRFPSLSSRYGWEKSWRVSTRRRMSMQPGPPVESVDILLPEFLSARLALLSDTQPRLRYLPLTPDLIPKNIVPPRVDPDFISPVFNVDIPDVPDGDIHGDIPDMDVHAPAPRILRVPAHNDLPPPRAIPPPVLERLRQGVPAVAAPLIARHERLEPLAGCVPDEDAVAEVGLGIPLAPAPSPTSIASSNDSEPQNPLLYLCTRLQRDLEDPLSTSPITRSPPLPLSKSAINQTATPETGHRITALMLRGFQKLGIGIWR